MEVGSRYTDEEWSQRLMTVSEFIGCYILNEVCHSDSFLILMGGHVTFGHITSMHCLEGWE